MSYTVLARKYRPQTFGDLVGQEHISRTLENAIESGRVAHAFLFTGARGVGKTTTARLLAKALNCERGPTASPCNECDPCVTIAAGTDMDVLEIDGASNNSVDDVRRLQESLPYQPARDRFKIVIVDEVHMLSTGAFNAFLKTLEEPPPHVKFIFATTEIHKVPITIRSRCQRHDFRLIPHSVIAAKVREILGAEGIEADDDAIALVAREAAGSMRDAQTLLDQLLAFGSGSLKGEEAARGLGIANRKHVLEVSEALLSHDAAACVRAVAAMGEQGLDVVHFARQLLSLVRDLAVLRVVGDDRELVELVDEERAHAVELATAHPAQQIERTFAGLNKLVDEVAHSANPQLTLEMGLLRLADRPALEPLQELVGRLKALEARLSSSGQAAGAAPGGHGGAAPGGGHGGAAPGGGRGGGRRGAPRSGPGNAPGSRRPPGREAPGDASAQPESQAAPAPRETGAREGPAAAPRIARAPAAPAAPDARETPKTPPGERAEPAEPPSESAAAPNGATTHAARPGAAPHTHEGSETGGAATTLQGIPDAWARIVSELQSSQPALGAVLEHGMAANVDAKRLLLRFPEGSFFGRQAASPVARHAVAEAAERVLGGRPIVDIEFGAQPKGATMAERRAEAETRERDAAIQAALSHPRVRDALEVFPESKDNVDVQVELE